jgi:hypothetical protein
MIEAPEIIQMNIERYRAMLANRLADDKRASVERLLAEALSRLVRATSPASR